VISRCYLTTPIITAVILAASFLAPLSTITTAGETVLKYLDQGRKWSNSERKAFYSQDQGSRIIPVRWIAALKQPNGEPFIAASLSRYGYLQNELGTTVGLPIGFNIADGSLGMTCSACHTRQIEVDGVSFRVDGGPAIADFQSFLSDLDIAVSTVINDQAAFKIFAEQVLGSMPSPNERKQLLADVKAWHLPFHTLVERALPQEPWGPSRLDAVSMIFNRLTGLDIGPPPTYMIPENIQTADAPVRYPFLWNAARQDKTQWPGFADNGTDLLGLARNLGEVYGVFGVFRPEKRNHPGLKLGIEYLNNNSANFSGLSNLEDLIRKIGPPVWPWSIEPALAHQGEAIFDRPISAGGCAECHGIRKGQFRSLRHRTWATPVQDIGTDSREYAILRRTASTGVLEGASIPILSAPLQPVDSAFNILRVSVVGSILQYLTPFLLDESVLDEKLGAVKHRASSVLKRKTEALKDAFRMPEPTGTQDTPSFAYESRVLEGIWAAAPYLHNGSVPTLTELLKPAAERTASFKVGPAYDPVAVGLAVEQRKFDYTLHTTDCDDRDSGNSRCGHEFGTTLSKDEKIALLEYLKTL